jgi:RND family efflux transporter MFP subunit
MKIIHRLFRWFLAGGALAAAGGAALMLGLSGPLSRGAPPTSGAERQNGVNVPQVSVAPVTFRPVQRTVEAVGTFDGYEEITVTPKVDGRVLRVLHDIGDVVRPGDLLLEIEPIDYQLAVQEAKSNFESELAKLGLTPFLEKNFDLNRLIAAVKENKVDINKLPNVIRGQRVLQNAYSKFQRAKELYTRGTSTKEDYDQAETDFFVAQALVEQARYDAAAIAAKAMHLYAVWQTAEQRLQDTRLTAPVPKASLEGSGLTPESVEYAVAQRSVDEGEMISRTSPQGAFSLVIDQVLKLVVTVPERYTSRIKVGQTAQIRVEAYEDQPFTGTVLRVSPIVDRLSRTFQVEILVRNPARELKSGGFAKAAILVDENAQALTVPQSVVVSFAGSKRVFLLQGNKVFAVPVSTGLEGRDWVEIVNPDARLRQSGARVVVSNQGLLADGMTVTVVGSRQ